jgi:hypothetical protein
LNKIQFAPDSVSKRNETYLESRYVHFHSLYSSVIRERTKNEILEAVVYAIIIYEDFNRPKVARWMENIKQKVTGKELTLGVMQVKSKKILSDYESVVLGTEKVVKSYDQYLKRSNPEQGEYYQFYVVQEIISEYNGGLSYASEINALTSTIIENFYKNTEDTLEHKKAPSSSKDPEVITEPSQDNVENSSLFMTYGFPEKLNLDAFEKFLYRNPGVLNIILYQMAMLILNLLVIPRW